MNKLGQIIAGVGIVGVVALSPLIVGEKQTNKPTVFEECPGGDVALYSKVDSKGANEKICVNVNDYKTVKAGLYNKYKNTDVIDVNDFTLVVAILNKEVKEKSFSGELKKDWKKLLK